MGTATCSFRKNGERNGRFYKAAVYEYAIKLPGPAVTYEDALKEMMPNLLEYQKQASIAGSQEVDIIVFPEDGIYGFMMRNATEIQPFLEYIPDPRSVNWNPCKDPDRFSNTAVQTFLSCLAKNNSMYLVANYGDAQPCSAKDPNCPSSGQYQYNTDIAFDRTGKLIARYHKQNLFFETQFNEPVHPEMIYFDTDFGRFGLFTCFDVLFHDPAIRLVKQYNITDVAFPTAWMDALPFFSAIGYHSSFAIAYDVNFLAANLHLPSLRFQGSGIYTPNGANEFFYDKHEKNGKLLVSDVQVIDRSISKFSKNRFVFGDYEMLFHRDPEFNSVLFKDWYNMVSLRNLNDTITICQEGFCCFLSYKTDSLDGHYAFAVFNGIHPRNGPYYLQVCILLRCQGQDPESCGRLMFEAEGRFDHVHIKGNFTSPYVTPQVVLSNNGSLELPDKNSLHYDTEGLYFRVVDKPLLEAALIGRVYESD